MKRLLISALMALSLVQARAQFTVFGTDPAGLRWHCMDSASVQLVFPDFAQTQAAQFRSLLMAKRDRVGLSMPAKSGAFSVLFHPYMPSNGMVVWTPKRMEINLWPPTDGSAEPWIEHLAIHEYRHVKQMELLGSGLAKIGAPIVGEIATGLMSVFVPRWLYEGDAVMTETALSQAGRGRQASFDMPLRALLADTTLTYSYDKMLLGSEKDFVPDAYVYGYHLGAYARKYYGADVWGRIIGYISWRPYLVKPKSFAIRKHTGIWQKELQRRAWNEWREVWKDRAIGSEAFEQRAEDRIQAFENENFVSASQSFVLNNGEILYCLSDRKRLTRWVVRNPDGRERVLHLPGTMGGKAVFADPYLVWVEQIPHPRYEMAVQSVLRGIHVYSGKQERFDPSYFNRVQAITFGEKHRLWVLSLTEKGRYRLDGVSFPLVEGGSLLPVDGGRSSGARPGTKKTFYSHEWMPQGQERVTELFETDTASLGFVTADEQGIRFQKFLLKDHTRIHLMSEGEQWNSIRHVVSRGDMVWFSSDRSGVDNIYVFSIPTGQITQMTNVRFGAFYPCFEPKKKRLWVTDYTAKGQRLLAFPLDSCISVPVTFEQTPTYPLADLLRDQEQHLLDSMQMQASALKRQANALEEGSEQQTKASYRGAYQGWGRHVNVHSWLPVHFDPASFPGSKLSETFGLGATAMSQNLLGSLYGSMSYAYMNQRHTFHGSLSYRRFWPTLSVVTHVNEDKRYSIHIENINTQEGVQSRVEYLVQEIPSVTLSTVVSFPFLRSFGAWNYGMIGQTGLMVDNTRLDVDYSERIKYRSATYFDAAFTMYLKQRMALLDLYPRWGVQVSARFRKQFSGTDQKNITAMVFLPGIGENHSWRLSSGLEFQASRNYIFTPMLSGVRFTDFSLSASKSLKLLHFDYSLPLAYPDKGIPKFLYIKKVHLNLFAEGLWQNPYFSTSRGDTFYGGGADFWASFHVLHFGYPLQAGLRTACDLTGVRMLWKFQLMFQWPF